MKRLSLLAFAATSLLASPFSVAEEAPQAAPEINTANVSYSLGMMVGTQLKNQFEDLDIERFQAAFAATLKDEKSELTIEQATQVMQGYQAKMQAEQTNEAKARGMAFLADNGKRDGVTTTESGLQYEVLTAAEGPKPKATDKVKVHYEGTLTDGNVFDSSIQRGEPISFALNGVIPGWTEGVQLMSVGSKYRFTIPSELAYGERGAGQAIGPHEVLVFEVELLGIE